MPRGSKPGESRGGRQRGAPNKRMLAVADKLEAFGCDPTGGMARVVMNGTAELSIRAQVYKELA